MRGKERKSRANREPRRAEPEQRAEFPPQETAWFDGLIDTDSQRTPISTDGWLTETGRQTDRYSIEAKILSQMCVNSQINILSVTQFTLTPPPQIPERSPGKAGQRDGDILPWGPLSLKSLSSINLSLELRRWLKVL